MIGGAWGFRERSERKNFSEHPPKRRKNTPPWGGAKFFLGSWMKTCRRLLQLKMYWCDHIIVTSVMSH